MKSFAFRLDRALHWRETQVKLQQARASAAAGKLAAIENSLAAGKAEIRDSAGQIARAANGTALGSYAGFTVRAQRQTVELTDRAAVARKEFAIELNTLKEANRKAQLLENLKRARLNAWQREFDREIGAFADEAFLARFKSTLQSGKGARSSGG